MIKSKKLKDSKEYKEKRSFFEKMITLYGRNVVIEILQDKSLDIYKLHLSNSNKTEGTIKTILSLAKKRGVEIVYHDKSALSRISKNARQDQGVAVDIVSKSYRNAKELKKLDSFRLIALESVQNPQNLGMIVRSCAAGNIDGIILPKKSSAKISPLVIKASAGTLFKLPVYYCDTLEEILQELNSTKIYLLSSYADKSIYDIQKEDKTVFVLGNESSGVSPHIVKLCNDSLKIPMKRGVESLNVAVTASIIAFIE